MIEYIKEENKILSEKPGNKRILLDNNQRRRFAAITERIAEIILLPEKRAHSVHPKHVESVEIIPNLLNKNHLQLSEGTGGGGIRTPVP